MRGLAFLVVLALAVGGVVGCYQREARIAERFQAKLEAFEHEKQRVATEEEKKELLAAASAEEDEFRAAEKKQAAADAVEGATKLATGSYWAGALLLGGAVLAFFGLKPRKAPAPVPPTPTGGTPT